MSIEVVESKIMDVLNTIPGIRSYDYEPKDLASVPCVTVQYNGLEQRRNKYGSRIATFTFLMRLYVGMNSSEKQGFDQLKLLTDQILSIFNEKSNADLQQTVLTQDITLANLEVDITTQNPRYIHTFALTIQKEV